VHWTPDSAIVSFSLSILLFDNFIAACTRRQASNKIEHVSSMEKVYRGPKNHLDTTSSSSLHELYSHPLFSKESSDELPTGIEKLDVRNNWLANATK
jgi:hypothetical protein